MRCHVAKHILAGKITGPTVCGYFGLTSCTIGLTSSSTKGVAHYKATSNYFEKSAVTSTKSMPCTNRPISCPHTSCSVVVWSYNLHEQYKCDHTDNDSATEKEISLVKLQKCSTSLLYTFM